MDIVNAINGLQDLRDKYVTLTLQPKLFVFFRTFTTFFFNFQPSRTENKHQSTQQDLAQHADIS